MAQRAAVTHQGSNQLLAGTQFFKMHTIKFRLALMTGALLCALLCALSTAHAARYELTVYSDDVSEKDEFEVETLFSLARPRTTPEGPSGRVGQMLTEVNYGLGHGFEIGLEIPGAYTNQQRKLQGLAVEAQYVAPHDKDQGWYWGVRADMGRVRSVYDDDSAAAIEVNPILGVRTGRWHFSFNPSVEKPLSGPNRRLSFLPSARIGYALSGADELGVEYFGEWGPLHQLLPSANRDESIYLVWEGKRSFGRINLGLGQGVRPVAGSQDKWVVKGGVRFEFD
jgi:hypothetical protein